MHLDSSSFRVLGKEINFKSLFLSFLGKEMDRREKIEIYCNHFRKMGVKIGKNVDIYEVKIDSFFPFLVEIGDNCVITGGVIILAHDASLRLFSKKYKVGRTVIKDNVFIGMDSVIMPGVEIGPNAIIGSNSVVTKSVPPNSVAAGVPARVICTIDEYVKKHESEMSSDNVFILDSPKMPMSTLERDRFKEQIEAMYKSRAQA